jgi:HD-GYP domain-containing protein (c-di-GMP phosphodiesterase class II)
MTPASPALNFRPTFECLASLSVILDLANGLAEDKSMLTGLFALELAKAAGAPPTTQWHALLAALLRHLGCTAYASVETTVSPDDIALRSKLLHADTSRMSQVIKAVNDAAGPAGLFRLGAKASLMRSEWTAEACGAARVLSERLALGPEVTTALDEVYERWDGRGTPHGRGGEALSLTSRLAQVAHAAVVFWLSEGRAQAAHRLQHGLPGVFDPTLCSVGVQLLGQLPDSGADFLAAHHDALLDQAAAQPLTTTIDDVAKAFGDFADLQSPYTRGHSRAVAALAEAAAVALGLPQTERSELVQAAHLHDLGQVAVPTSIWVMPRAHRPTERERAKSHVYFTERVLASAAPLAGVAKIAGAHHERLDGTGYFRSAKAAGLPRAARVLAVAEVFCGLQELRPHRAAFSLAEAKQLLAAQAGQGLLDGEVVDAVLSVGTRRAKPGLAPTTLSERELQVLRLLATGQTNKQIAVQLGISPRTVQHHTIHVYEKLCVDTRAGAALVASERGLLEQ